MRARSKRSAETMNLEKRNQALGNVGETKKLGKIYFDSMSKRRNNDSKGVSE